jgi:hypothetical protein
MADVSGDGAEMATPAPLSVPGSFTKSSSSRRRGSARQPSMDADEFMNLLHGSDPVKVELNRLENEVRGQKMPLDPKSFWDYFCLLMLKLKLIVSVFHCVDKDRELSEAQAEIKALRHSERLREKAVEEVIFWLKIITLIYAFLFLIMLLLH